MVWIVEKIVAYHLLDMGYESVNIPVRVEFEFELCAGSVVPDSVSKKILYNLPLLKKRYPALNPHRLQEAVERTVDQEIRAYFVRCGYRMKEADGGE